MTIFDQSHTNREQYFGFGLGLLYSYVRIFLIVVVAIMLAACSLFQSAETPAPTLAPTVVVPGELFRASGEGPMVAEPFSLDEDKRIRVNWEQSSSERFLLLVVSLDPDQQYSKFGRVIYEFSIGSSSGFGDYDYIAVEYVIEVKEADGPWEVWIETIDLG